MTVNKNKLVTLLNLCLDNTGLQSPGPIESPFLWRSRGDRGFSLTGEGVTAYQRVIGELLRERQIADRYSIKAIQEKLDLTLIDLVQLGQTPLAEATLRSHIESLLDAFQEDFPETGYYLAVANLRVGDTLELGPLIIEPLTQHKLDTLFEQ